MFGWNQLRNRRYEHSTHRRLRHGPLLLVDVYVLQVIYNVLIVVILKIGSANIMWMASTVIVPLNNVVFRCREQMKSLLRSPRKIRVGKSCVSYKLEIESRSRSILMICLD